MEAETKEKFDSIDKIIYILIAIIMIGIPFLKALSYVPYLTNINEVLFKRARVYFIWISIIFSFLVYLYSLISNKRKLNYIDYLFFILGYLGVISTISAIDLNKSIFGEPNRYEGLLTLFSYYLVALNAKNIRSDHIKKKILNIFIILGVFQSIMGILQSLTAVSFVKRFPSAPYMAFGLCSNPNFYGSYIGMLLGISCILFIKKINIKNILLVILFSINLYLCGSLGPLLAFIITFVFLSILYRKSYKKLICLFIIISLSLFISDKSLIYVQSNILNTKIETKNYIKGDIKKNYDILKSDNIKSLGTGRLNVWINSIPLLKKYWLTGCGIDNFRDAYPQKGYVSFDKAHNVYIQIGVTNGVIALIVYLSICLIAFLKSIKNRNFLSMCFFISFVFYSIQAFSNISVIDVAPYFYLILGLLISCNSKIKQP